MVVVGDSVNYFIFFADFFMLKLLLLLFSWMEPTKMDEIVVCILIELLS